MGFSDLEENGVELYIVSRRVRQWKEPQSLRSDLQKQSEKCAAKQALDRGTV